MTKAKLGILGKIESDEQAKTIIRVAAVSAILLAGVTALTEYYSFLNAVFILAPVMAIFNSRIAAVLLSVWYTIAGFWNIMWAFAAVKAEAFLALHKPLLCFLVLWFMYRAVRAAFFIHAKDREPAIETIQNVFE